MIQERCIFSNCGLYNGNFIKGEFYILDQYLNELGLKQLKINLTIVQN